MKNIKKLKDPGSAITHFIGMIMALFAATPLLIRATHEPDTIHVVSLAVFIVSMILLYAASTAYHSFNLSARANLILKKIDHMMIFVLIAGTYTPMCLIVLHGRTGYILLAGVTTQKDTIESRTSLYRTKVNVIKCCEKTKKHW